MKKRGKLGAAKAATASDPPEPAAPAPSEPEPVVLRKKKRRRGAEQSKGGAEETPTPVGEAGSVARKRRKLGAAATGAQEAVSDEAAVAGGEPKPKAGKTKSAVGGSVGGGLDDSGADVDRTVFVDGVPYVWTEQKVEEYFTKCGAVSRVRAPVWQDSGRLRGFAHVTFADKAGQKNALAMDGTAVGKKNRYLKIEPAKPPASQATLSPEDVKGMKRLFVKNLPYDATEQDIAALFTKCGKVREVRVPHNAGRSKGFAYVEFAKAEALRAAVELQPPPSLGGRTLRLDVDGGSGPKAGFHYRKEALSAGYGPASGRGRGRGEGGGRGRSGGKLSLF